MEHLALTESQFADTESPSGPSSTNLGSLPWDMVMEVMGCLAKLHAADRSVLLPSRHPDILPTPIPNLDGISGPPVVIILDATTGDGDAASDADDEDADDEDADNASIVETAAEDSEASTASDTS